MLENTVDAFGIYGVRGELISNDSRTRAVSSLRSSSMGEKSGRRRNSLKKMKNPMPDPHPIVRLRADVVG